MPAIPALRCYPSPGMQGHVSLHAKSSVFLLRSHLGTTGPVEKHVLGRGEVVGTLQDLGSEDRIKTQADRKVGTVASSRCLLLGPVTPSSRRLLTARQDSCQPLIGRAWGQCHSWSPGCTPRSLCSSDRTVSPLSPQAASILRGKQLIP